MTSVFEIIKENLLEKKYSFLDIDYLKSEYKKEKDKLDFVFDNYIIIGIGGSSQGSKAVAEALNKEMGINPVCEKIENLPPIFGSCSIILTPK